MAKNSGKFALVQRGLNKSGKKTITARATDDILIKRGQLIFFNEFEEEQKGLVKNNIISAQQATENIEKRRKLDAEYDVETVYSLRAGNPPVEDNGLTGTASGSKL